MLVSLPNGRTVDMPFDDYMRMGMEGYQYLVAQNFGAIVESPFYSSMLNSKAVDEEEEEDEEEDEVDGGFFVEEGE